MKSQYSLLFFCSNPQEIIARERNIAYEDVPEIPIVYEDIDPEIKPPSRLAEENETPDFKVGPGNFKPVHDELYEHVIWNREAAREKYVNVPPPPPDYIKAPGKYLKPLHLEKKPKSTSAATNQQLVDLFINKVSVPYSHLFSYNNTYLYKDMIK